MEPDLLWDEVRELFDPELGHLPDVYVSSTTSEDWQRVVDLVRTSGMSYQCREDGRSVDLPAHVGAILDRQDATMELWVWPAPEVLAIFRFSSVDEIDFDVDLRELQGQDRLDVLCGFLRAIGREVGKPVLVVAEGSRYPLVGYDPVADTVSRAAQAW
ncbi:hypothetical protein SAMN05192558_108167 [Actinokineospora alba]|uniref:Uncharacterized protein n=1 Tax=Actinokineospora alba TaxID=504798 RepID=A0A1H0RXN5_9PSEU|nr:hypothetical protein [Actinokineospora alba]TDP66875.1 hypothetical protein C8E96_2392 [Actinokineospora alba]SDI47737.1 hypothetical protein SAMN05421871_105178 [Actinokineospora alba]SDP34089.1 hypothetical protein SAMN05192558_108167 [Actinokineospora alba]